MISRLYQMLARRGMILLMVFVGMSSHAAQSEVQNLVEQGQRAFEAGAFSRAVGDWQKAAELFRSQGNTNAEIRASVSLAGAYQCIGQYQPAVKLLDNTLTRARRTQERSLITLVEWKLGA